MANEINELRVQLAEGISKLTARIERQGASLDVLRFAIAFLLKPQHPEFAEKDLKNLEALAQQAEAPLQDSRELLAQIRKIQEQAL